MSTHTNINYPTAEEFLSELERDLLKERDPMNRHKITLGYVRLMSLRELSLQTDAVAWTVGVIDEFHSMPHPDSIDRDKFYKGVKNGLRDRYRSETGIDPAPDYPINIGLMARKLPEPEVAVA